MPQFSKGECKRSQQLIERKLFISYGKSKEKAREEEKQQERNKCTKGSRPPTCREKGKREDMVAGVDTVTFSLTMEY